MLAPFLDKDELTNIFGKDMLNDIGLKKYFDQLIGNEKTKPFECVGTRAEVNEAVTLIKEKYKDNLPILLQ